MRHHLFRQRQPSRHQNNRPDNRVKTNNILSHQVHIRRPIFLIFAFILRANTQSGNVVHQSVKPNVNHVFFIKRHLNTPIKRGAGNAQILQALLHKVNHLVAAAFRLDKIRVGLNKLQPAVGIFAHFEEVAFLLRHLHRPATIRTNVPLRQLMLREKGFTGRAIPTGILGFINIPLVIKLLKNLLYLLEQTLYHLLMPLFRGADKIAVVNIQQLPKLLNTIHNAIHKSQRFLPSLGGPLLNFQAVLIGARQKIRVKAPLALVARHRVGSYCSISVADMQLIAGIINRRGDIKSRLFCHHSFPHYSLYITV